MTDGLAKLEEEEEKVLEEWATWKMFQEGILKFCLFKNFVKIKLKIWIFYFFNFRFRNGFRTTKTKRNYLGLNKTKSG